MFIALTYPPSFGQAINPSVTPDYIIPGGPYLEVENTGADQAECDLSICTPGQAFCWDGASPGIATTFSAPGTLELAALPAGAHDPDIVFANQGQTGMVVYELNNDVYYTTFTNVPGGGALTLGPATLLRANASHPNIDKQYECEEYKENVVVVYRDDAAGDIAYKIGPITGGFGAHTFVSPNSITGNTYIDRFNPDVAWLGKYAPGNLVFTAVAATSPTNFIVDVYSGTFLIGPSAAGPVSSSAPDETHPKIDGILDNTYTPSICYHYSVTYHSNNLIYQAFNGSFFTPTLQPAVSNTNELPAVAYAGDINDVIWSSDALGGLDIIGQGFVNCTPDPYYKEANTPASSTGPRKLYPSIAGHCQSGESGLLYAMCWWDQTNSNMVYKYAQFGVPHYKNGGYSASQSRAAVDSSEQVEAIFIPSLINKNTFNTNSIHLNDNQVVFYDLSGKEVFKADSETLISKINKLKSGMYLAFITTPNGAFIKKQKVIIQ